jgi:hypothetical protein
MNTLLTRDEFRKEVFERDGYRCVFCPSADNLTAHHIMERRLWGESQGYFKDNGITVCPECHIECEKTLISVEDARKAGKITNIISPAHFYEDQIYDKWGNIILPNGMRTKGELFHDDSVQKILKDVLHLFTDYVKYPRTHHLPWSASIADDDRVIESLDNFVGKRVICSVKMDGENTTLYKDYYHARSIDSKNHPSRNWAKALHARFAHEIPEGWRICCENLYAQHSIKYNDLESYLYGFSIWNDRNECLDWDTTVEWFALLGLSHVPVIYDGIFDEDKIKSLYDPKKDWETKEGYVVRLASRFSYGEFRKSVCKFVRPSHVQTTKHWMTGQLITPNGLRAS